MRPKLTAKNLLSNDGLGYVLCHFPKALSFTNAVMRFKTWGTYLGYMLNGTHICFHTTPLISLYIRSNKLVHPNVLRNPGKIISITVPTFEALTQFGAATITTKNIGEVEASYSLTGSILSAALPGLKLAGLS